MKAIMRIMRPRSVMQTASMMVWVWLSIVDDEEVEIDTIVAELDGEGVVVKLMVGLVGITWLVLSVAVVVVEESWVGSEDGTEDVVTSDEVWDEASEDKDANREDMNWPAEDWLGEACDNVVESYNPRGSGLASLPPLRNSDSANTAKTNNGKRAKIWRENILINFCVALNGSRCCRQHIANKTVIAAKMVMQTVHQKRYKKQNRRVRIWVILSKNQLLFRPWHLDVVVRREEVVRMERWGQGVI
jgi:hypothetical protein